MLRRDFMEVTPCLDWWRYSPPLAPASLPESELLMPLSRLLRSLNGLSSGSGVAAAARVGAAAAVGLDAADGVGVVIPLGAAVGVEARVGVAVAT
jgi:hypothetical protein